MIAVVKEHFRYVVIIVIISISLFLYFLTYDRFSARLTGKIFFVIIIIIIINARPKTFLFFVLYYGLMRQLIHRYLTT